VLKEKYRDQIEKTLGKYPDKRSAVMPLLYMAQEAYGHLSTEAIDAVAEICALSRTQVKSIAGFYTMYHEQPRGKFHLQVCTDLPCALRGSEQFLAELRAYLGIDEGEITEDGLFSIEHVMCLAACDRAPVMQINFSYCLGMDIEKAKSIIEEIRTSGEYTP